MELSFPLKRVFVAIPLEGEARRVFQDIQKMLSAYEKLFRFQNPESPHLTLQYWDELMEIEYHQVIKQAGKIVSNRSPFTLRVTGADTFEDRVLFLSIAFSDELARFKKAFPWPNVCHAERSCARARRRRSTFLPHITLARMRSPEGFRVHKKKIMKMLKNVSFEIHVDRLRLYAEVEGVRQTPLAEFVLG